MVNDTIENITDRLLDRFQARAIIFDLDGTLIDNNEYHRLSWIEYLKSIDRNIGVQEYREKINGRTNRDVIKYLFGDIGDKEILRHTLDKEALYRKIYRNHIKPVDGLFEFLACLHRKNIPMAIATSGIQPNIDFMFEHVPIKQYFRAVVHSDHIKKGKPDPEIYTTAAVMLNRDPNHCIAFEDAMVGIRSAKAAGMNVVAITTTEPRENLSEADLVIADYRFEGF